MGPAQPFESVDSVYRQFRRWTLAGVWDVMLEALNEAGADAGVQMTDFTIVRAHQHTPGRLKRDRAKIFAAQEAASRLDFSEELRAHIDVVELRFSGKNAVFDPLARGPGI